MDRLVTLREMCSPQNSVYQSATRILRIDEWPTESAWGNEANDSIPDNVHQSQPSIIRSSRDIVEADDENDEPQYLYLIPATSTGLVDWEFHQCAKLGSENNCF